MNKWTINDFVQQKVVGSIWLDNGKIKTDALAEDIQEAVKKANAEIEEHGLSQTLCEDNGEEIGQTVASKVAIINGLHDTNDEIGLLQDILPDGYELWPEGSTGPNDSAYFQYEDTPVPQDDAFLNALLAGFSEIKLYENVTDDDLFSEEPDSVELNELDVLDEDDSYKFANPWHDKKTGEFTYRPGGPLAASARYALKRRANSIIRTEARKKIKGMVEAVIPDSVKIAKIGGVDIGGVKISKEIKAFIADYVSDLSVRIAKPKVDKYIDKLVTAAAKSRSPETALYNLQIDQTVIRDVLEKDVAQSTSEALGTVRRELRKAIASKLEEKVKVGNKSR